MAGIKAIAVVSSSANGDGASVSRKRDAAAGVIGSGFSIDVSPSLFPITFKIPLINTHMAGIKAIAVVVWGANGDDTAVSRKRNAVSRGVIKGFSIDVSADFLPSAGYDVELINAHMAGISGIAVVGWGANGNGAAVSRKSNAVSRGVIRGFSINIVADLVPIAV